MCIAAFLVFPVSYAQRLFSNRQHVELFENGDRKRNGTLSCKCNLHVKSLSLALSISWSLPFFLSVRRVKGKYSSLGPSGEAQTPWEGVCLRASYHSSSPALLATASYRISTLQTTHTHKHTHTQPAPWQHFTTVKWGVWGVFPAKPSARLTLLLSQCTPVKHTLEK